MLNRTAPRAGRRPRALVAGAVVLASAATMLLSGPASVAAAAPSSAPGAASATASTTFAFQKPQTELGTRWNRSDDRVLTGIGDVNGFHILQADERQAFRWTTIATLNVPGIDVGPWTGYTCTTGDGRYVAAVYAPSSATNSPAQRAAGAFSAVVDVATHKVTQVASGIALNYFTPSCGLDDHVIFSRNTVNDDQTQVFEVDARTGAITRSTHVNAQFTTPVATSTGIDGIVGGALVRLNQNGSFTRLAQPQGQPYQLMQGSTGGLDLLSLADGHSVLQQWNGKRLSILGKSTSHNLGLFQGLNGHNVLVGDTKGLRVPSDVRTVAAPHQPTAVSLRGDAVVASIAPTPAGREGQTQSARVEMRGALSRTTDTGLIALTGAATSTFGPGGTHTNAAAVAPTATAGATGSQATASGVHAMTTSPPACDSSVLTGGYDNQGEAVSLVTPPSCDTVPTCLVPRNDPTRQVLQPSENMVEWAVDQAVHGQMNLTRPADWNGTGESSYSPESMFPPTPLTGGGTIPAQVMLGILAQESNLKQASWHAVPGDSGNPLNSDYYGNQDSISSLPNYAGTDCGYGIAQVTNGMSTNRGTPMGAAQATAVATDYAANIAAGVQILGQTWNELLSLPTPMTVNNGSSQYIENWYFAIWGYNSGVYTDPSQNNGRLGLGWANNPANPAYNPTREFFMRYNTGDAAHPGDWPYQEKVLGWADSPQVTYGNTKSYSEATYSISECTTGPCFLNLPSNYDMLCSTSVNNCDSTQPTNPCPAVDSSCWWNQPISWISGDESTQAATEHLAYSLGSSEPAINRQYPAPDCLYPDFSTGGTGSTVVIGTIPDSGDNIFGCPTKTDVGKFQLRLGDNYAGSTLDTNPLTYENPLIAQIDLHQLGAGWMGHIFFTHSYALNDYQNKVTGAWTLRPDSIASTGETFDIRVHLPSHGSTVTNAHYVVAEGDSPTAGVEPTTGCTVSQATNGTDTWLDLGSITLYPGARVMLNNLTSTGTGTADVAFDAVAFTPYVSGSWCPNGTAG
ncbi:hypothetical protein ABH940_006134 [Streptacidiphilus sp. BW17]|uniref:hypothetical protein n=1 Tax=Streptacidiphilus sp. BW17 TaxID=3156274 RepID=UPI003515AAF0